MSVKMVQLQSINAPGLRLKLRKGTLAFAAE